MSDGYVTSIIAKDQQGSPKTMDMVSLRDFKPELRIGVQLGASSSELPKLLTNNDTKKYNVISKGFVEWCNKYYKVFGCAPQIKTTVDVYFEQGHQHAGELKHRYSSDEGMLFDVYEIASNEGILFEGTIGEFSIVLGSKQKSEKYTQQQVNVAIEVRNTTNDGNTKALTHAIYVVKTETFGMSTGSVTYEVVAPITVEGTPSGTTELVVEESDELKLPEFPTPPNEE